MKLSAYRVVREQAAGRQSIYSRISGCVEREGGAVLRASEMWRVVPRLNEAAGERIQGIERHLKSKLPKQVVAKNLTFLSGAFVA